MHKLKYQTDLPPTIGKPGPYLHQIKQLIQDFEEEDQDLLFIYGPFSNSIRDDAQRRKLKKKED